MMKEFLNTELQDLEIACGSALPGIVDTPIQENIRAISITKFPSVGLFQDFKHRDELLAPATTAKFLSWVLMKTNNEEFVKGD